MFIFQVLLDKLGLVGLNGSPVLPVAVVDGAGGGASGQEGADLHLVVAHVF